jgi:hypothetical protein
MDRIIFFEFEGEGGVGVCEGGWLRVGVRVRVRVKRRPSLLSPSPEPELDDFSSVRPYDSSQF